MPASYTKVGLYGSGWALSIVDLDFRLVDYVNYLATMKKDKTKIESKKDLGLCARLQCHHITLRDYLFLYHIRFF